MADLLVIIPDYEDRPEAQKAWEWIHKEFSESEGICYYKHPVIRSETSQIPDFTVLVRTNQPLIAKCLKYQLDEIVGIEGDKWITIEGDIDSPILELDDFSHE